MAGVAQGLIGSLKTAAAASGLPAGTILMFDRTTNPPTRPIPSGWSALTSVSGSPIERMAIRGSTTLARNVGTNGVFSFELSSSTVDTQGGHLIPTPSNSTGPGIGANALITQNGPAPWVAANAFGAHNHSLPAGTKGPFTLKALPANQSCIPGCEMPLIQTTTEQAQIPANCIVFSGTGSLFSGFTRFRPPAFSGGTQPAAAGMYCAATNQPGASPAPFGVSVNPFTSPSLPSNFSSPTGVELNTAGGSPITSQNTVFGTTTGSGAHRHGAGNNSATGVPPGPTTGGAQSTPGGFHTHSATSSGFPGGIVKFGYYKQFTHLLTCVSGTAQDVTSGMIFMYGGGTIPAGWNLCDGTNGTPNLVDQFIGYDNSQPDAVSNVVIGTDAIGGNAASSNPAMPINTSYWSTTPGPSATVSKAGGVSVFYDSNSTTGGSNWGHTHNTLATAPRGPSPSPTPQPGQGGHRNPSPTVVPLGFGPHTHSFTAGNPAITLTVPTQLIPAHLQVVFIQKA